MNVGCHHSCSHSTRVVKKVLFVLLIKILGSWRKGNGAILIIIDYCTKYSTCCISCSTIIQAVLICRSFFIFFYMYKTKLNVIHLFPLADDCGILLPLCLLLWGLQPKGLWVGYSNFQCRFPLADKRNLSSISRNKRIIIVTLPDYWIPFYSIEISYFQVPLLLKMVKL